MRGAKPRRGTDRSSADPARYTGRKTPGERVPPPPIAEPFAHLRLRASHPRTYRNPAIRTKIRKIRGNPARGRVFRRSPPEFRCLNNVIRNSIVKKPLRHAEKHPAERPSVPLRISGSARRDASGPRYLPQSALLNEKFIFFKYFVIYELDKYFFIR